MDLRLCFGFPPRYGFKYSHTVLPLGTTSKNRPLAPSFIKVFPLSMRCAPEIKILQNDKVSFATYLQAAFSGP